MPTHYWCIAGKREGVPKESLTMTYNKNPKKKFDTFEHLSKLDIECINTKYDVFSQTLDQYPSFAIPQLYQVARHSNFFKRLSKQRKSRINQVSLLQTTMKQFEKDQNKDQLITIVKTIKDEIDKESHCLGKSCLHAMCVNILINTNKMKKICS